MDGPNNNSTDRLSDPSSAQSSTTKSEISTLAQDLQQNPKDLGHSGAGSTPGSELNNDAADRARKVTNVKAFRKSGELI